jgi:arylsulfatase A-like enzyme
MLVGCGRGRDRPAVGNQPPSQFRAPSSAAVRRLREGAAGASLLIVVADAARPDHFGFFGYPENTTPGLDALFADSTVFTEAYATAPETRASISSLFTSQFPDTHGMLSREAPLSPEPATLAECMQSAGFQTALFSANPFLATCFGLDRGFETARESSQRKPTPDEAEQESTGPWLTQ